VTLDLDDDERAALVALLRRTLDQARYPLAPRYDVLRAILDKLDPPAPRAELPPPIRSGLTTRKARGRRR
jgi:hypothetical protein